MNGVVNLMKPPGITSRKAVTKVQRLLGAKKAGHSGTLDPLATGVLLVCLGEATKIARFFTDMEKEYVAQAKLGERTDTFDAEGMVIERREVTAVDSEKLRETVSAFLGSIVQMPPMFSAVKVQGKPLYKLARKGIEVARPPRTVTVYRIEVTDVDIPYFRFIVSCSKGTYIRTLCDDIGLRLGTGAHLVSLERTRVGPFDVGHSCTLEDISNGRGAILEVDAALGHLPEISPSEEDVRRARNGMPIDLRRYHLPGTGSYVRLKDPFGNLFALGEVTADCIRVERILHL